MELILQDTEYVGPGLRFNNRHSACQTAGREENHRFDSQAGSS